MRVLLAAIQCEKDDVEANLRRHVDALEHAATERCHLALFPEMSLTGSVDPATQPERAITLDDPLVERVVAASQRARTPIVFGIAERLGGRHHITQVYAASGRIRAVQRKRHLGEGEEAYSPAPATDATTFTLGAARLATVICAESTVDFTWDAAAADRAHLVLFTAAPGLYGRRTDEASWRSGFDWWHSAGVADARSHARRLGLWVAIATQAGSTCDEDFPGTAALIAPSGEIVDRLPDWRPGHLIVDVPVDVDLVPVRNAVRVLVVDRRGRTLLAQFGDGDRTWWVPPGGGIEAGEDDLAAARRELREELGRDDLAIGACIGRRGGTFPIGDGWFTQYERWYVCRCDAFEVDDAVVAAVAGEGIRAMRWWTADELRSAGVDTGPRDLASLVDAVTTGAPLDPAADLGL